MALKFLWTEDLLAKFTGNKFFQLLLSVPVHHHGFAVKLKISIHLRCLGCFLGGFLNGFMTIHLGVRDSGRLCVHLREGRC